MAGSTFQTSPFDLHKLLDDCHHGVIQLPDFQRSWVWDEERIKSVIFLLPHPDFSLVGAFLRI